MKNFDVLSAEDLFFLNTPLRVTKKSIGSSVCLVLAIINLEVVTRKFLNPADLSRAQTLCFHELSEVVIVGKNEDFMLRVF